MARKASSKCRPLIITGAFTFFMLTVGLSQLSVKKALAQEATPSPASTPKSDEVLRLEDENAQAQLRKSIAEANKAEVEARFPKPSTTPLAGTTTITDGAVIESQMISYISMAKAANRIVDGLKLYPIKIQHLAIYNERDVNLLLSYRLVNNQVKLIKQGYCGLLAPSVTKDPLDPTGKKNFCRTAVNEAEREFFPAPFTLAQSALGAFVDMTALFRTNVEIRGNTFDIDEGPLVAEVFRAARRPSVGLSNVVGLYYPYVMSPNINLNQNSDILRLLEDVRYLRTSAAKLLSDLEKKNQEIEKSKGKIEDLQSSVDKLEGDQADAEAAAIRLLQAYCGSLAAIDTGVLDKVRRAERTGACPQIPGERLERLLELRDTINALRSEIAQTKEKTRSEENKLNGYVDSESKKHKGLYEEFEDLKSNLNSTFNTEGFSLDDAVAQVKALNEQLDKLINSLVSVDTGTGVNPLTNYIRAENLLSVLPDDGSSYWLQLKVLKAGGNNRIKTNLLIDLFNGGNRVSHSGGVIVQYNLFDSNGKSVVSDTITDYTNYIKAGKVKNLPNSEIDDMKNK